MPFGANGALRSPPSDTTHISGKQANKGDAMSKETKLARKQEKRDAKAQRKAKDKGEKSQPLSGLEATETSPKVGFTSEKTMPNEQVGELYRLFCTYSFIELEKLLLSAGTRQERAFYRSLLNLKLQIEQEKVIGEVLL